MKYSTEQKAKALEEVLTAVMMRSRMIPNIPGAALSKFSKPELKELNSDDFLKFKFNPLWLEQPLDSRNNKHNLSKEKLKFDKLNLLKFK